MKKNKVLMLATGIVALLLVSIVSALWIAKGAVGEVGQPLTYSFTGECVIPNAPLNTYRVSLFNPVTLKLRLWDESSNLEFSSITQKTTKIFNASHTFTPDQKGSWILQGDATVNQKVKVCTKPFRCKYVTKQVTCFRNSVTGFAIVCGDNILDDGEQCDDGNLVNNDGCSSACRIDCDDSLDNDGDGKIDFGSDSGCTYYDDTSELP